MKNSLFLLGLIGLLPLNSAFAAKGDVSPGLDQCAPVMDSKVYLTSDFHAYPREVAFECSYKCNVNGKIDILKGVTRIVVSNMQDDATGTTCQGVVMKQVPWGWDFDKVQPFYAPETGIIEIKRWAFENINFNPINNIQERQKLTNLKKDLYTIASSFIMAGVNGGAAAANMKEAGLRISMIAEGLPMNTKYLDEAIEQIVVNKGSAGSVASVDGLTYTMLKSAAAWRIPSHLFK